MEEAIAQYLHELFGVEDDHLRTIRTESVEEGLPAIHVQPEEGRLLQFLVTAVSARRAVEIGTLAGYSGTWIARALPEDGRLITLEKDPHHAEVARRFFDQAGFSERVEIRVGSAMDSLKKLSAEGPFDVVFIDANKDGYPDYLNWAIENVRIGGLIMAHNAIWSGAVVDPTIRPGKERDALLAFNRQLAEDPRLLGIIIPLGDGLAAAIRVE